MKIALAWIFDRLKEESTWRGIVQVTTGGLCLYCALYRTPLYAMSIAGAGQVIVGMINGTKNQTQMQQSQTSVVVLDKSQPRREFPFD
ncbi:MAG: hypothetical protein WCS43_11865 [Verrucomicrobiota bacterium]